MSAPFRIRRPPKGLKAKAGGGAEDFKYYLGRLLKMIPAEIVSLYLTGTIFIPEDEFTTLAVWSLVCLAGLIRLRAFATADPDNNQATDWVHVAISSVAFVIWVYSLGGPFQAFEWYAPHVGKLLILTWTFFLPFFYKGPQEPPSAYPTEPAMTAP